MQQSIANIDKCKMNTKKFVVQKTKKEFIIQDGILKLKISFNNKFMCPCNYKSLYPCIHVYQILSLNYKLTNDTIKYYYLFTDDMFDILKKTSIDYENVLMTMINSKVLNDVCGICLNNMKCDEILHECNQCKKFIHKLCLSKWIERQSAKKTCIYCNV